VRFGRVWSIDPKYGPKGGDQDAVVFFIDINDRAVEALVLRKAGGRDQSEKEETEVDREKRYASL
jgi:hypothetical protein